MATHANGPKTDPGKGNRKLGAIGNKATRVAKQIYPKRFAFYKIARGAGSKFSYLKWKEVGGTQQEIDRIKAQSGNAAGSQKSVAPALTVADLERFRSIQGPGVKQSSDAVTQERKKPSGPRQSQNIWLTENELIVAVKAGGWKCFGCGNEYGSHVDVGNKHYEKVDPEQMHVTKTRKMGGTKFDVRVGCSICNDVHGNGKGMSDLEFQAMVKKEFEQRGYRSVRLTEVR